MNTLREFICYNQKQTIKFEYIVSQLHRNFKRCYNDKSCDIDELKTAYEILNINSFLLMEKIFKKNLDFINNSIGLQDQDFRTTIKIVDNVNTIDIFRSHNINKLFYETPFENNTAFKRIITENKKFFLCDDLESLYRDGQYQNPRINNASKELLLKNQIDWKECWNGYGSDEEDSKAFYQSTFVIPMSITSEEEDKNSDFYSHFFKDKNIHQITNRTRTIWGFLCFDSKHKNYFKTLEIDYLDLGFIIADILSIYLVFFHNYTSASETVKEYEEKIFNQKQ